MKLRCTIYSLLIALVFGATTACSTDKGVEQTKKETFPLSMTSSSTTAVTIEWTNDKGDNANYTINVYTDAELTELYQSIPLTIASNGTKRFTVPYLDCVNEYHIVVEDSNGNCSETLSVMLENTPVRREILSQNFDNLFWGYDYVNMANGVKLISDIRPGSYTPESLTDARNDSQATTTPSDDGGSLFNFHKSTIAKMGFEGWSGSEVRIRPGYAKLGSAYNLGKLSSPKFEAIGDEATTIHMSFKVCIFSNTMSANAGEVTASIIKADGTALWQENLKLGSLNGSVKWEEFKYTIENVTAECHFEICTNTQVKQICVDALQIERDFTPPAGYFYGYVTDKATGEPIEGVAMSDGFSVTTTDAEGFYKIVPHQDAWYVFYSVPADCEVLKGSGLPKYFTRVVEDKMEYNFELRRLPNGKEEKFALFTFADPQVSSKTKLNRFTTEAVPGICKYASSLGIPCYGITLGDIVSTSDGNNTVPMMSEMHEAMNYKLIGMPVFQVMGNHDNTHFNEESPLTPDETSSTFEIKAQRAFETTFGPINFSFNRGDIHIVGMRDIVYHYNTTSGDYLTGFLPEQYEWLKQDLAVVPKDKMVVLCVHIPLYNSRSTTDRYVKQVHQLLSEFKEAHVISGHTHVQVNYETTSTNKIYEHNMGTVCGTWWASHLCGCGTPNGYGVFIGEGNTFTDWYYMGYAEGMDSRDYQFRLYRGNAITGAEKGENKNGQQGYYAFHYENDVILANVFNADSAWKIEVYENGEFSGYMTKMSSSQPQFKNLIGSYTFDDPRRAKEGVASAHDMWVAGIHLGILDRYDKADKSPSNGSWSSCTHMYKYTLKDADADVKVVAIDRFGRRYESSKFVDYRDNQLGY